MDICIVTDRQLVLLVMQKHDMVGGRAKRKKKEERTKKSKDKMTEFTMSL